MEIYSKYLSIICIILAQASFTTLDMAIKFVSGDYALHQITLFRAFVSIIFTLLVLVPIDGGYKSLLSKRLGLHLIRGFGIVVANLFFFTALVNLLGPAKNVRGREMKFFNNRTYDFGPKKGKQFNIEVPTSYMFSLEFHNKAIIQGCLSFDVQNHGRNHMELYGTKGSIIES